jgi:hypothetical protein
MKKNIGLLGVIFYSFFSLLPMLLNGCLTSAGGQDAAKMLSAQMTLVAEEGKRFADARNELAKARLRNMQMLENSLVEVEEENAIDLQAWRVVGAKFRTDLYEGVMAATKDEANRHQLRKQRRERQEKEIAKRKSAVKFKQNELIGASKNLAFLSQEVSPREERARLITFTEQVIEKIQTDSIEGTSKAKDGEGIVEKVLEKLADQNLIDGFLSERKKE